jgi:hypothetical protein
MNIFDYYQKNTPQRTKLIDVFMAFLVVVGALQFLYCILAGNYVRSQLHSSSRLSVESVLLVLPGSADPSSI